MKKLLVLALAVSVVTLCAFWAGQKTCLMVSSMGLLPQRAWYADMGLSPDQMEGVQGLESSFRKRTDAICVQICREKQNLLEAMDEPAKDRESLFARIDAVNRLQASLEREVVSHILSVTDILSPSQNKTYHDRIRRQFRDALKAGGYGAQCAMAS